ncbi:hypothetical protein SU69_06335 [Thermosipho melanesiensis]|uniref:Uncharacterized protein n=2 Tax=Thermosipho melanesiensis TaxID=46541 RepID=A6LME9_THEM4|nr:hypothetical protein [Thermosipho melanesiensis]ABR31100.1 hypothetical protein Tmel_1247 [Thermosipho melanesiensis BI429]APT74195.1 hypothetical protein BW47_06635 [Thermosipho melanesiensis]OOC36138.1 hypothetical protein SU68_06405 [Thermosipho melanesiensis]OOC36955.1 hypothetical protein SU69_06335 [Thermosipho melanesiensis]OOC37707.1 hypothetical protein SU70_06345 [Thermosipho melanesiensis]
MKIKFIATLLLLFFTLSFATSNTTIHASGCSWESLELSNEINIRVHQWLDLTWDATPFVICDKETNELYYDDGFVLLSVGYDSNASLNISIDFPDPRFRNELGDILENISIYFFVKSFDAINEESYFQFNYNLGDLTRMGTDTSLPVWLPEAMNGVILFTLNTVTSDPGSLETPAGIYHLPVRIVFYPTVTW